ncbi:MAG: L,D-transpeptidase family protein [Gammaproteobacteria bacterium]|nr:L,D-transpeptidase family protein [Gammaproteobacteria bacterium]
MSDSNPQRHRTKSVLSLVVLVGFCLFGLYHGLLANRPATPEPEQRAARPHLIHWLETNPDAWPAQDPIFNLAAVRRIYRHTDYRLLWFDDNSLTDIAIDLLKQLTATSAGNPSNIIDYRYHLGYFDRTLRDTPQRLQMAAVLDVLLTDAFVSYAQDTRLERLKPNHFRQPLLRHKITPVNFNTNAFRIATTTVNRHGYRYLRAYQQEPISLEPANKASRLTRSKQHHRQRQKINQPASPRYRKITYTEGDTPFGSEAFALRNQLSRYRAMNASGRWQPLPAGPAMTVGARHSNVARLRNMLTLYGDYYSYQNTANSQVFDRQLHHAVLRFQKRHGLRPDGIVGRRTRERLNISPVRRARIIEVNLQRRQKLPADLGEHFIQVNVPEYKLHYVHNGRIKLSMKVVVGKKIHATPEISTRVSRVIFNPTWTVPRSIVVNEIVPKARADHDGMYKLGYRVVNGKGEYLPLTPQNLAKAAQGTFLIRQKAGANNILGRIKFEIPNRDDIYLHDTRARTLFSRTDRGFSHGCIRLAKPQQLAEALLRHEKGDWDSYRIQQLTTGEKTSEARLANRVAVYITYWTAWVDGEGRMQFRPDIYAKDIKHGSRQLSLLSDSSVSR